MISVAAITDLDAPRARGYSLRMLREDVVIADREGWRRPTLACGLALALLFSAGCSIRKLAVNGLAGAFSGAGDAFASD
ncbi:MAG: hypothetical protein V3T72_02415, partial [Thermoanaerobaculia bacterium]